MTSNSHRIKFLSIPIRTFDSVVPLLNNRYYFFPSDRTMTHLSNAHSDVDNDTK